MALLTLALLTLIVHKDVRAQAPLFVARDGRDEWSGHLASPNLPRTDGPFATLGHAVAAASSVGRRSILVRAGAYYLPAPLRIEEAQAGLDLAAYPGEQPVIYGGLPLPPKPPFGDGLATTGLPILLVNGQVLPLARLPSAAGGEDHEAAWRFAGSTPQSLDLHQSFRVKSQDGALLDAAALPGAMVTIFGAKGWQNYVLPVRSVEAASQTITLDGKTWDAIGEGSRYAVLNTAPAPGEWRYDPSTARLSVPDLHGAQIVAASLPCIVTIEGTHDIAVRGLRLAGSSTEGAALCLDKSSDVTLDHLAISSAGDGIRVDHSQRVRVLDSEIARTAGSGIVLRHSDSNEVRGNFLHDIGWLHADASAIWFEGASANRFVQNRIETVAKFGVGGGSLADGASHDNLIEGNEIDHANQRTSDGGGIMLIGWSQDIMAHMVRGNVVTRTGALGNMGWDGEPRLTFQDPVTRLVSEAIYLDDWASGVEVSGNLLCNNIGGIEVHAGWSNRVHDNILIGNAGIAIGIDAVNWLGGGGHPQPMADNLVTGNTVIVDQLGSGQTGAVAVRGQDTAATFDFNLYAGPGLNDSAFHQEGEHGRSGPYSFGRQRWRGHGQDAHSTIGLAGVRATLRPGALDIASPNGLLSSLPLGDVGRPEDRAGLADRLRQRCGLP